MWKAIRLLAGIAEKMHMHIIRVGTGAIVSTKGIFCSSACIVDLVNQPMFLESF